MMPSTVGATQATRTAAIARPGGALTVESMDTLNNLRFTAGLIRSMTVAEIISYAETKGIYGRPGACTECLLANIFHDVAPNTTLEVSVDQRDAVLTVYGLDASVIDRLRLGAAAASVATRFDRGDLEHLTYDHRDDLILQAEVAAQVAAEATRAGVAA